MGKKFTQKPTKLQKITTAAVAALALGSGLSVAPANATVNFENMEFYTLEELFAAEETYNAEVATCQETPHAEPTNCYKEVMSQHVLYDDASRDIFRALHIFQVFTFTPLSFNPARNTIDVYYRDFDVLAAREGQNVTQQLTGLSISVPFPDDAYVVDPSSITPNQVTTLSLDGYTNLLDDFLYEVQFDVSTDGYYQLTDRNYYFDSCVNSDSYKKGMHCDLIVSADGASTFYPFGEPDPEPTNPDPDPNQNSDPTTDPNQNSDPATDPDPNQNTDPSQNSDSNSDPDPNSTSDPTQDPASQNSGADPTQDPTTQDLANQDPDPAAQDPENSDQNSNQSQPGSSNPEDNGSAGLETANVEQSTASEDKTTSTKTSAPLTPNTGANTEEAGNDADADFPWWLVATLGLASFLASWWILPAKDYKDQK